MGILQSKSDFGIRLPTAQTQPQLPPPPPRILAPLISLSSYPFEYQYASTGNTTIFEDVFINLNIDSNNNNVRPNKYFDVSPEFISSIPRTGLQSNGNIQIGSTSDVLPAPIQPSSDGYIRCFNQKDQISMNRFTEARFGSSITSTLEPFNMLNLFAGLYVGLGDDGRLLYIHGIFYRPMNKIHLENDDAYFYNEYKIGNFEATKVWNTRNIQVRVPANTIITGIVGASVNDGAPYKLYFITYNLKTKKHGIRIISHAPATGINVIPSVYLNHDDTRPIEYIRMSYSPSNHPKDIISVDYELPSTKGYFNYYKQFTNMEFSLDSDRCISLPQSFRSFQTMQSLNSGTTVSTIYKHHQDTAGYKSTPQISVSVPQDSYISGLVIGQSTEGRMVIYDFMINKFTNGASPNDSIKCNINNELSSVNFVDGYKNKIKTCILPPNSYLSGIAQLTSHTDYINYGTTVYIPIIKYFIDPTTPKLYFSNDLNIKLDINLTDISKIQYFYFDNNTSYNTIRNITFGYNPAGGVGASIESMRFIDITDKIMAMSNITYAGKMVLSQYNFLTDQQYTSQILYTEDEKRTIGRQYCSAIFSNKLASDSVNNITACKSYARYNSNIDLDNALTTSYCKQNPNDEFCSCSMSYKDPGLEASDPVIRELVYNNRVCYYPKCREAGYKFTTQVDRSGNPLECKVPLQICSQRIDASASTSGSISDIQATCQSNYPASVTPVAAPQPPPIYTPTPTPIYTQTSTQDTTNPSYENNTTAENTNPYMPYLVVILILLICAVAFIVLNENSSVSGGNPKNINYNNNNINNINDIDYRFV
jgi:hypothetical protein